jgi:hypothetical protein
VRRRLAHAALLVATLAACAYAVPASAGPRRAQLAPGEFQDLSTGVAKIVNYTCAGRPVSMGTGFLVGRSVVMTARHVLKGACHTKVTVDGATYTGGRWTSWWRKTPSTRDRVDLATLKLNGESQGHLFTFRPSSPALGTNMSMLGYPLGNQLSLNQGTLVSRAYVRHVPLLMVRMLGAEGASGSPLVDDAGHVVGILQLGAGSKDAFGQRTAGVLLGLEFSKWGSPTVEKSLCAVYPTGGVAGCSKPKPPPPPDFTVGLAPVTASAQAGGTAVFLMTFTAANGFDARFTDLQVTGLPGGTVTWGTATGAGVPFAIGTAGLAPGTYPFVVTATGASLAHTVNGTLSVTAAPTAG